MASENQLGIPTGHSSQGTGSQKNAMVFGTLCPGFAMPPRGWREPRRRRGTRQEQDDEDAEWEDESDWLDEDGQERGISGRNGCFSSTAAAPAVRQRT